MAGYIFALGKDDPLSIYERCAKDGVYSTSLFTLSSIPFEGDRKSTRLNSSHRSQSRMPSSA